MVLLSVGAIINGAMINVVAAETRDVEKTTTGYGADYQEALSSALLDAVRQVRGLQVGSEKQLKLDFQALVNDKKESSTATLGVVEDIFTRSKGWVKSYEVKKVNKPKSKEDTWSVTVVANIPQYDAISPDDKRQRIAILPFRFSHDTYSVSPSGETSNAYQMSGRVRDRIQTAFTQTQQFAVVNRNFSGEFASEKALLSSDNVPAEEASRIGQVVGADLMVVGNIYDLSTKTETKEMYGMSKARVIDHVDLSYQLIEVATQKILWAETLVEDIERPKKKYSHGDINEGTYATLDAVSKRVLSGVMDVLFPVKILDVIGEDEIYLNQGKARINVGDVFVLYSTGRSLNDPDTGVKINVEGKQLGELKVVNVMSKYSVAELTEGKLKQVKKGAIVRLLQMAKTRHPSYDKEVRPTAGSSDAPVKW